MIHPQPNPNLTCNHSDAYFYKSLCGLVHSSITKCHSRGNLNATKKPRKKQIYQHNTYKNDISHSTRSILALFQHIAARYHCSQIVQTGQKLQRCTKKICNKSTIGSTNSASKHVHSHAKILQDKRT